MSMTLAEVAEHVHRSGNDTVTLGGPTVRYRSMNISEYDACMDWCAQAWMSVEDLDGYEDEWVCVGCADFLTIRLGRELVADNLLDSYSQTAVEFSPLFDGDWLDTAVQDQFDATPINDVVVVLSAELAPPVRGHQFGAWMISEISDRMLSSHDGLVVLTPVPEHNNPVGPPDQLATARLSCYWRTCGLVPVTAHPEFLAQSSAYTHLEDARTALTDVARRDITVTVTDLARWSERYGCHDEWT
ncbi:hypothetical protein [Nocardia nepalensis]|uniref:hypothetical protein n=1 Tax=Nocardia nepalensis TaxID=3375448 RepID=UPI003B67BD56